MVDFEKFVRRYCFENDIAITISYDMPAGYETANGMFDPTVKSLFINRESLKLLPEYEQLFYLYHELRHASQYLHPEQFDDLICKSRFYVILYDGTCFKLVENEWAECRLEGTEEYFSEMYLWQPYEVDANEYACKKVKEIFGDTPELEELHSFWIPKTEIQGSEYENLYSIIDDRFAASPQ